MEVGGVVKLVLFLLNPWCALKSLSFLDFSSARLEFSIKVQIKCLLFVEVNDSC